MTAVNGGLRTDPVLLDNFGPDDVDPEMVGLKAANLMRMADAGLPVPPGFTVTTDVCDRLRDRGRSSDRSLSALLTELLATGVAHLEEVTGHRFGARRRPLVVSVRSGAPVSMPGMLDTVLDVGLTGESLGGLLRWSGDPVFVADCHRRLLRSWAEVVAAVEPTELDATESEVLAGRGVTTPGDLDRQGLLEMSIRLGQLQRSAPGPALPAGAFDQLAEAVRAVAASWDSERAVQYRRLGGLPDQPGTAVTVQAMVFGNLGVGSGSGVGFTRDPSTGEDRLYVDFAEDAQGEDVVAGLLPAGAPSEALGSVPGLEAELERARRLLERTFGDAQDFEFTVEEGRLWLLQTRAAKRTPLAAVQIACDLVAEGLIDPATAVQRLDSVDLAAATRWRLRPGSGARPIARAVPASGGVATGEVVLDGPRAVAAAAAGRPVVLVRPSPSTDDVQALARCRALLTAGGSRTSHAAVVARQLGTVCLVGCPDLTVDSAGRAAVIGGHRLTEGDVITLDGTTGDVYLGPVTAEAEVPRDLLDRVEAWRRPGGR